MSTHPFARGLTHAGSTLDLEDCVKSHLFLLCPNNSGSSFLQGALATSAQTWNLPGEGQYALGFAGPTPETGDLDYVWASSPEWVAYYRDSTNHDWQRSRKVWYFQARSRNPDASVFTTKSPPFLLIPEQLHSAFPAARFLFMLRDPYATAVGIRRCRLILGDLDNVEILRRAARHLIACFEAQRRNIATYAAISTCFSYEEMCDAPELVESKIAKLVPALDDLRLRRKITVKSLYSEPLRNMNAQQIANLTPADIGILNAEFGQCEALFAELGYPLR